MRIRGTVFELYENDAEIDRAIGMLKLLGAGNGAGFVTSGAALHYFATIPKAFPDVKALAVMFGNGTIFFAFAAISFYAGIPLFRQALRFEGKFPDDISFRKAQYSLARSVALTGWVSALLSFSLFVLGLIFSVSMIISL